MAPFPIHLAPFEKDPGMKSLTGFVLRDEQMEPVWMPIFPTLNGKQYGPQRGEGGGDTNQLRFGVGGG